MGFAVTYYCPHCGAFVDIEREGYLADKAVTPFPFEGWTYATPDESFEDAEGVRFVCGERSGAIVSWKPADWIPAADDPAGRDTEEPTAVGCGEPFYLSFVKFAGGEELDPRKPSERVRLSEGIGPKGPSGPRDPDGPGGFWP
ncbi:hypothetical protein ACNS7O_01500 [Haloferacaceae archaeon DSL9]